MIFGFSSTHLDLRGLNCPLPALRTRKMLRRLAHGDCLIVECTDPLAVIDIPRLPHETGDTLERQEAADGLFIFYIKLEKHETNVFSPVACRCRRVPAPLASSVFIF